MNLTLKNKLIEQLNEIVTAKRVLTQTAKTSYYRCGFRSGKGEALAVVFPRTILEQWRLISVCVDTNCIIIMQAANTGLTEGSTPSGSNYDREVVIINTLLIKEIHLINDGKQAISLSGASLHNLGKRLA